MRYNLPDRVLRELFSFARNIPFQKLYCLVLVHEALIQKEAILISLYMEEILTVFIGMSKKKSILF